MDYKSLLNLAEKKQEARDNFMAKQKAKSTSQGPSKEAIAKFKAKKEREELEKLRKAQQDKERLLTLRAQSGKSSKKMKMMKNRTKDNDFSKSVMTAEMVEEQRKIEEEIKRKEEADKRANNRRLAQLKGSNNEKNCDKKSPVVKKGNPINQLSYEEILKLGSEKSKNKVSLENEILKELKDKKGQQRPMTQKEKDRLKEEMYYKMRAEKGLTKLPSAQERRRIKQKRIQDKLKIENIKNETKIYKQSRVDLENQRKQQNTSSNSKIVEKNVVQNINKKNDVIQNKKPEMIKKPLFKQRAASPPPSPPRSLLRRNLPPIGSNYKRGMYDDEDMGQYVDDDEYEEEDDDDMADFIDDGPIEEDYSKHIREIFGYDKRKYRYIDDDDDIQESSFADCMKEETRSARLGRQEDLEDMRKEEEEKRLKRLKQMKKSR